MTESLKEIQVLQSCAAGDSAAFEIIVHKYQSLVCAITYSAVGQVDKSEELAQQAFINAWKGLDTLKDPANFKAWLIGITRNVIRTFYRTQKRDIVNNAAPIDQIGDAPDHSTQPLEMIITKEQEAMVQQSLEQIPEIYREPMVLFYRQQQSTKEVAQALDLTEETVRTRLMRGRKLLKEQVAAMVESTLSHTGPGKAFTTMVVASIAGLALTSATAEAASGTSNVAAGTSTAASSAGSSGLATGITAKIITAAAIVAVGIGAVFAYKHLTKPQLSPAQPTEITVVPDVQESVAASAITMSNTNNLNEISENKKSGQQNEVDKQNSSEAEIVNESQLTTGEPEKLKTGIRGTILVKGTEQPIQKAKFFTDRKGNKIIGESNSQGFFEMLNMKPRNRTRFYVTAANYTSRQFTVDIVKNKVYEDFKVELTPCYKVTGTVSDPNGNPIEGVSVATFQFTNVPAITDKEGRFNIDGLDPSWRNYSLHATHPNYPAVGTHLESAKPGQTVTKDIVLAPGVTVYGHVTDSQGQPVANVNVGNTTSRVMWNCIKSKTDVQGMYELKNIPAGELVLWAFDGKHAPFVERYSIEGLQSKQQIDFQLPEPVELHGKLIDQANNPVSGVYISIREFKGVTNLSNWEGRATSDTEGKFVLKNAPPGGVVTLEIYGENTPNMSPEIEIGQEEEYLIQIERAGRIYGKVVADKSGEPISSFKVKLGSTKKGANQGYGYAASWSREGHNFTSREGFFDTGRETIPIGAEYCLTVYADGYGPLTIDPIAVQPISESPDRTEFRLQPETILMGRIFDCNDIPVAGARIHYIDGNVDGEHYDDSDVAITDLRGVFKLAGSSEQKQIVYVTAKGHAPFLSSIKELPRNAKDEIEIKLVSGAILFGRVIDQDGEPLRDVSVSAHIFSEQLHQMFESPWPNLKGSVTTNFEGYYEIADLPAGNITVNVNSSLANGNRGIGHKQITLVHGESTELNFGDEEGYTVSGTVRKGQEFLKNVNISVSSQDYQNNQTQLYGHTDQQGKFKIKGFKNETYMFFIEYRLESAASSNRWDPSNFLHDRRTITIQGDMELDIDFGDGSVSGVIPEQFIGYEELKIYIRRWTPEDTRIEWGYAGSAEIADDGVFTLSNLRTGKYYVQLASDNETLTLSDTFELGESEHLEGVAFKTGSAQLNISVIDAETKLPIPFPGFSIKNDMGAYFSSKQFMSPDTRQGMLANENGQVLFPDLSQGRYFVTCTAPEYLTAETDWIELEDNQKQDVTVALERAAIVRFEVSEKIKNEYTNEALYIICNIKNLITGEKVNPSKLYRSSDGHLVWLYSEKIPEDCQSVLKLPEGSYAIEYRLYSDREGFLSYRIKSPLSEKTVEVNLVKTQESVINISE